MLARRYESFMAVCSECHAFLPEGARFCPVCATPVGATLGAQERKLATLLFADLVGSTALAADQDPEQTRLRLDRFYTGMAAEIRRAGGTLEKFAGDAVLAVFGAPAAYEDHAERALHAALWMQRRLRELFGDQLALRIGVNTGEVMLGEAHAGSSFASGDAVNVAARLEQAAAPGEILAGDRTVAAAGAAFEFGERRSIEAKGKPDGVPCRELRRALSLMRPRGVGSLNRTFVGRQQELERLLGAFRRAVATGSPQVVSILGEAGVGKTRLVRELWDALAGESPRPLRRVGRCVAYGRTSAYQPLGEVLSEHYGFVESDSPEHMRSELGPRAILGLALGLDVMAELHPLAVREQFREAWRSFLGDLVAEQPAVIAIEDLHWADGPLVELLSDGAGMGGPLLLLATARPEAAPLAGGEILLLEPLAESDGERLLNELLGATPPAGVHELVERAQGNPFFVEEILSTLIDRGLLARTGGAWTLSELPADFGLPDSVRALLAARVDLLPSREKAALQAGAVIGPVFWAGAVRALTGDEPDLEVLEERAFAHRRAASALAGETEYAIKHALTREVVYDGIPKGRRARAHAALAEWLEEMGHGQDEHAAVLAHHYAQALSPEYVQLGWPDDEERPRLLRPKAVAWLRRAAALAVGRYELEDGLDQLHRALELEPSDEIRAQLWREAGRAHALMYDGEAFWRAMERSLEVDRTAAGRAETYSLLAFETANRGAMWKRRPETELVESWVEHALELAEPGSPQRARALIAAAGWDPVRRAEGAREASRLAEQLDDLDLRSAAWGALAAAAFEQDRFEEADGWTRRRLDVLHRIADPDREAETLELAVPVVTASGRLSEGRELTRRSEELGQRLSAHHRLHAIAQTVDVEELAGEWARIRELTPLVEERVAQNVTTPCVRNARSLLVCALAWAHGGDDSRCRELAVAAEGLGMEGYGYALDPLHLRLALVRSDLPSVSRLLETPPSKTYTMGAGAAAARLDGLAALGDRSRVEAEAGPLLRPGIYLEPFALRALGTVRGDEALLAAAAAAFDALGLGWHADQTRMPLP